MIEQIVTSNYICIFTWFEPLLVSISTNKRAVFTLLVWSLVPRVDVEEVVGEGVPLGQHRALVAIRCGRRRPVDVVGHTLYPRCDRTTVLFLGEGGQLLLDTFKKLVKHISKIICLISRHLVF
jgi:hypothetical protein